jgi:hypothetical protein
MTLLLTGCPQSGWTIRCEGQPVLRFADGDAARAFADELAEVLVEIEESEFCAARDLEAEQYAHERAERFQTLSAR